MLHVAIEAAELLEMEGISARVVDLATVKPLDEFLVTKCAKETGCVVTAEEHSTIGGLGDAVGEVLLRRHPIPLERVGVKDSFGRSGSPQDLLEYFGLTPQAVLDAAKRALKRKMGL
jgi:transketolase